ncbi:hypothetical protein QFZ30_001489 [Arthrobacter pascens]|uniref:DUF6270 domain-containing protein n=1 Tax=Arthrobacter pascens TaxID=1677 RepID=UPI00278E4532|nr:DUF6270 domain-containing protein [Arthrobacter pascens]MDQ0678107.1 hypothetical protein [Arthrobacter pascens]
MGNIFIYGGCVTRDAFEHLEGHTLLDYVARQSLISAASAGTDLLGTGTLASAFQNRSLDGDIKSTLLPKLRRRAADADLVLMDLLSERLGVLALADGSYVTNSRELRTSGRLGDLKPKQIAFGTDRHFNLWQRAVRQLMRNLSAGNLTNKVLVIETPWATLTDTGEDVTTFRGIPAAEANTLYLRYYDHLRTLGLRAARIPEHLAVSSLTHKWGPGSYHYADPAYHWMREQINAAL